MIANRILADQGVVDGFGHISVRSASNPEHYFMAVSRAIYTKVNAEVETASLQMGKPVFLNRFEVDRTERVVRQWEAWAAPYTAIDRRYPIM